MLATLADMSHHKFTGRSRLRWTVTAACVITQGCFLIIIMIIMIVIIFIYRAFLKNSTKPPICKKYSPVVRTPAGVLGLHDVEGVDMARIL